MIRILTADEPACTTITVDGMLYEQTVESVHTCCMEALSKGKPVRLHLRDVSAINECGRGMLRRLAAQGVGLTANGIYSAYIVGEIQSASLGKRHAAP